MLPPPVARAALTHQRRAHAMEAAAKETAVGVGFRVVVMDQIPGARPDGGVLAQWRWRRDEVGAARSDGKVSIDTHLGTQA